MRLTYTHSCWLACVLSCVQVFVMPWLLCPWNFPGKNTGVGCHFLLQRIFLTQGLKLELFPLFPWEVVSLPLGHLGSPIYTLCCCSVTQLCPTLCNPMDYSMSGLRIPHHLPEFAQVHVHCFSEAIWPSHPMMLSSPSALDLSQYQGLFQ